MFDVSLLNKSINFFWKNLTDHNFWMCISVTLYHSMWIYYLKIMRCEYIIFLTMLTQWNHKNSTNLTHI